MTNQIAPEAGTDSDSVSEQRMRQEVAQEAEEEVNGSTNELAEVESCDTRELQSGSGGSSVSGGAEGKTLPNEDNCVTNSAMVTTDESTNQVADTDPYSTHMVWMSSGAWQAPPFSYRQDGERVVFVLHSRETKPRSLVNYCDQHMVRKHTSLLSTVL